MEKLIKKIENIIEDAKIDKEECKLSIHKENRGDKTPTYSIQLEKDNSYYPPKRIANKDIEIFKKSLAQKKIQYTESWGFEIIWIMLRRIKMRLSRKPTIIYIHFKF